jgi:hypothetical protein
MTPTIRGEVKKSVAFIFAANAQGNLLHDPKENNPIPCGTGFFVAVKNDIGQGPYVYLVTAKHVLKDKHGTDFTRAYLRVNKLHGDAGYISLDLIKGGHRVVFSHSDPSVDIAVVPMEPLEVIFDLKVIPEYMLTTKDAFKELNITEGSDIFLIGLYNSCYGEQKDIAIVRFGHVSLCPDDRLGWKDYSEQADQHAQLYLIEMQPYGCNGGSPVFILFGAGRSRRGGTILGTPVIKLAGIMRGMVNEAESKCGTPQNPIAAVTPSYLLDEILFSEELRKLRDNHPI